MSTLDLLNKYAELTETWMDKQKKLDNYVQQWLNGETQMSAEASKLAQDVNISYGVDAEVVQENTQGGMRKRT